MSLVNALGPNSSTALLEIDLGDWRRTVDRNLALELAPDGTRVNTIACGACVSGSTAMASTSDTLVATT